MNLNNPTNRKNPLTHSQNPEMLCATARPLFTTPTTAHFTSRRLLLRPLLTLRRHSLSSTHLKMSSSTTSTSTTSAASPPPPETIEHIVLLNVKPDTDPSQITAMLNGLNGLISLPEVLHITAGPLLRNRSTSLRFTHMLHSRYLTKPDLAQYSAHPAHMSVVKSNVLPICDDVMAVDWVARNLSGPISPRPGSAMRVQFLKLIEGLGEREKEEVWNVIGGLKEKVKSMDDLSFGENFSPGRAKGFSIASIGFFPGVEELDSVEENVEISTEKDKVRDYIDSLVVVDYVVPFPQSASL